jgi:hypothetical protein
MKKIIFLLILILSISNSAFAFPPTPPGGGGTSVSDTAYDAGTWNAVTDVAPSKNAVRDKFESLSGFPIATAAGTADIITADYTPDITLTNLTIAAFIATAANATTTPTFAPDGLAAHTIVKKGGVALVAGDIPGALAVCFVEYNLANTRWELLNPAFPQTTISGNAGTATALFANGANCGAGNYPLGVDASGAVESCTAVPTSFALDAITDPIGAKTFTLLDNQASALSFGATGAADILKIGTLNTGPGVTVSGFLTTTGQLLSPDGTAGVPSISFASEPTSGWFHPAGGITGLSIAASERLRFTAVTGGGLLETLDPSGIGGYASSPTIGSPDVFFTRKGAANWRFGIADAAAPVAQTLSLQGVVTGTSNTAGANFTLIGSTGTGSGAGGSLIFQVAPAGGPGNTPNAPATALTIDSTKLATFTAGISATSLTGTAISDSTSTTSSTVAASSTAVKAAYDLAYGPPAVQSVTCTDSGNGSHGALTITPTAGPGRVAIDLTVADADGCTITMAETAAVQNTLVTITNISAYHADFANQAGVLKLFGSPFAMAQNEGTTLLYTNSQWNEKARATATLTGLTFGGFTASKGVASDGSGNLVSTTTTAAEIGYLAGVTSAIQTQLDTNNKERITATFDGGGTTAIVAGMKAVMTVPFACTITGGQILASKKLGTAGVVSIKVNIWREATPANYDGGSLHPAVTDTICGSGTCPTVTAANAAAIVLTSWDSVTLAKGDILIFNAETVTDTVLANVTLYVNKI